MSEQKPFMIITNIIPAGVELGLAKQRNTLIGSWRDGKTDAETTARNLMGLYRATQHTTNGETNVYLMDGFVEFCAEADLDNELSDTIWQDTLRA